MARSRRLAVDDNNTWLIRADYLADPLAGADGSVDHGDVDYIVFANDGSGDEPFTVKPGLYGDRTSVFLTFVVWGKGVVSFGPPTADQIAFMASATNVTDLGQFPGAFLHAGFTDPATTDIYVGIRDPDKAAGTDQYTVIKFGTSTITIYADRITFSNNAGVVDFGTGVQLTAADAENGAWRLPRLITFDGDNNNNVIDGTAAAQTIHGLGGHDTIRAGTGATDIYGDDGNDRITGGIGKDRLFGGEGIDTIKGGFGDSIDGGGGNDKLTAERGMTVDGGSGVDRLHLDFSGLGVLIDVALPDGTSGTLAAIGTSYTGIEQIDITGGANNDKLSGNSGNNIINGGAGADVIDGGAGNDTLDAGVGGPAPQPVVDATSGALSSAIAIDTAFTAVDGGSPHAVIAYPEDIFFANAYYYGFDVLEGGHLFVESDNGQPLSSSYGLTLLDSAGNLIATNTPGLALDVANLPADRYILVIESQSGNGFRNTGLVNVSLSTATTPDLRNKLTGGTGNDTFLVHAPSDLITEKANEGIDTVIADLTWTLGSNLERLVLKAGAGAIDGTGNTLANIITGNASANLLKGDAGDDTMIGGGGNDLLRGDAGSDRMEGGAGDDIYRVTDVGDRVIERFGEGRDTVVSAISWTLSLNVENLRLTGNAVRNGTGNALDNVLEGNTGANVLDGGLGRDIMLGGAGDDTYIVDSSGDLVFETLTQASTRDAGGLDSVVSSASYTLDVQGRQFVENLSLTGTGVINGTGNALANRISGNEAANVLSGRGGDDRLVGNGGNDRLIGGDGADVLLGGAGSDRLEGGNGKDTLTGGTGADTFVFAGTAGFGAASMAAADFITDFSHAELDQIDLRGIDANTLVAGDQAFVFRGTAAFTGKAGQLRIETTDTATYLVSDTNGDGLGDGYVHLKAGLTLVVTDFLL